MLNLNHRATSRLYPNNGTLTSRSGCPVCRVARWCREVVGEGLLGRAIYRTYRATRGTPRDVSEGGILVEPVFANGRTIHSDVPRHWRRVRIRNPMKAAPGRLISWRAWTWFTRAATMSHVTRILSAIEQGDPSAAEQLLPLVYEELRKLAAQKMAQEKPGQTLQATALVHEAYFRLVDVEKAQHWDSRAISLPRPPRPCGGSWSRRHRRGIGRSTVVKPFKKRPTH